MKNSFVIALVFLFPLFINAQKAGRKNKVSYSEGTLFGYWGYNATKYSNSNIRFKGNGYDFSLLRAPAHDNDYPTFDPLSLTNSQFNARLGYYFWNYWALSVGFDHFKYILQDGGHARLSGEVDPGLDANLSGSYSGEDYTINQPDFYYSNRGFNYMRIELTRSDPWIRKGKNYQFTLTSQLGVSAGGLLSYNNYTFGGMVTDRTVSMSGYGVSLHAGIRLEFWRHFFIQPSLSAGLQHQLHVQTRPSNPYSFARQAYGYGEFSTSFGFLFYIREANGCQSCPIWN